MIEKHTGYFRLKVEIKYYNVMIDRKNFFDQPVNVIREHMVIYKNLQLVKEIIIQLVFY